MAKLICLLIFPVALAAQIVEGTVVNSATGSPLPGVKVNLITEGVVAYSTVTDQQGHFLFDHVQDGVYLADYSAADYNFEPGSAPRLERFQVAAGASPVKLEARMTPLARLSGRVVDGRGKPVPGALVWVTGPSSSMVSHADKNGKFDLHQFMLAGAYTLSAAPPPGLPPPDAEPGHIFNWTRTYYPGVTDPEAAAKITLLPGGVVSDLELKILAVPAHPVRGVLLNPDGSSAPNVEISLGPELDNQLHAKSQSDGAFEFPAVVDGEWNFAAEVEAGAGGVKLRASQWFEMAGHQIEGVKLRLAAPFALRGKVLVEAPDGAPAPRVPGVILSPHVGRSFREVLPDNGILTAAAPGSPNARPDAAGDFTFPAVYPGTYRILPSNPPPGYYLDSIRLGESEPSTPEVEISSGAAWLTLVYKANGGAVRGAVENCASGGVVLVPQDPAMRRPGFLHSHACNANSHYSLDALRPGNYYVVALSGNTLNPWYRVRVDNTLLDQASSVTIRAGETTSLDLRASPPPPN